MNSPKHLGNYCSCYSCVVTCHVTVITVSSTPKAKCLYGLSNCHKYDNYVISSKWPHIKEL